MIALLYVKNNRMDLNRASVQDLEKIPGLGREEAEKIVQYRDENGGFDSMDEVENVPGFSSEMVDVLRKSGATVGEDATDRMDAASGMDEDTDQ